jgi:hypothetical protein
VCQSGSWQQAQQPLECFQHNKVVPAVNRLPVLQLLMRQHVCLHQGHKQQLQLLLLPQQEAAAAAAAAAAPCSP